LNIRTPHSTEFAVQPAAHQLGFQRIEFLAAEALQAARAAFATLQHKLDRPPAPRATMDLISLSHDAQA
jgi:hypothetical protein